MTVYYARALREQYPDVVRIIDNRLSERDIDFVELDSSNLWCRDYMPIKTGDCYTKFNYKRNPKFPWLEVNPECWSFVNAKVSDIYLDGGNTVQNEDTVFMTKQVFKNNPTISSVDLEQFLKDRFEKRIVFLPVEPGDTLGHADGIVKFNNDGIIINDHHNQTCGEYSRQLEKIINAAGYPCKRMPWAYKTPSMTETDFYKKYPMADEFEVGFGYYINWYQIEDVIFLPVFRIPQDDDALLFMHRHFPGYEIVTIDCSDLSMLGGLLNCVTWEM